MTVCFAGCMHALIASKADEPSDWDEDDYAIDTQFGRIYMKRIRGTTKWHWFLQTMPTPIGRRRVEALPAPKAASRLDPGDGRSG
jgi:hypothetical protein